MTEAILVLNAGSSSLKFSLFALDGGKDGANALSLLAQGACESLAHEPHFVLYDVSRQQRDELPLPSAAISHETALHLLLEWVEQHEADWRLIAVGHRVVHGGTRFSAPVQINAEGLAYLEQLVPLAPLHQPHTLAAIRAITRLKPDLPQVACFDTAFHRTQPVVAQSFALPRHVTALGVERYGFHGLSYEYIASVLPQYMGTQADGRVVIAHLGSGASMCALRGRKSCATTMSFTPLDGLPMATRCGALDPGVILYLLSELHMDVSSVTELLYQQSGLLGVSGESSEMTKLLASHSPQAREAIDLFVYSIGRALGSLAAAIGGLDALVFTGGIGEHAELIRAQACLQARWLGVRLDESANHAGGPKISADESAVSVWVIPTDEDVMIARHTRDIVSASRGAE